MEKRNTIKHSTSMETQKSSKQSIMLTSFQKLKLRRNAGEQNQITPETSLLTLLNFNGEQWIY